MTASVPVVAIDGPAGAGKGTVAAALAARWSWRLLDSGALYRVVGLLALRRGLSLAAQCELAGAAREATVSFAGGRVLVDGRDETAAIRAPAVAAAASQAAAKPQVRAALLAAQRAFRRPPGLVADGRDMGTVVFPDAALKVFLTATAAERALRRYRQLKPKQPNVRLRDLSEAIEERDRRDRDRAVSPLVAASDAVTIDTTRMTVEEVVAAVVALGQGEA